MHYHTLSKDEVLREVKSAPSGLTLIEAGTRLKVGGKNKLPDAKKPKLILNFFNQFKDVMVIILLISAIISISIALIKKNLWRFV